MERTQIPNPHKCRLHKHLIASGAGPCAVSGSQRGPARPGEQALPGRRSCGETPRASGTSPRLLIFQEGVPQSHSWGVPASRAGCEHSTRPLWRRLTEGQTPTDCSHTVTHVSWATPESSRICGLGPLSPVRCWHSGWSADRDGEVC